MNNKYFASAGARIRKHSPYKVHAITNYSRSAVKFNLLLNLMLSTLVDKYQRSRRTATSGLKAAKISMTYVWMTQYYPTSKKDKTSGCV